MKPQKPFSKVRSAVSLIQVLQASPFFRRHGKLIPRVERLLNRILGYNQRDGGVSSITRSLFVSFFGPQYSIVLRELEKLGLLTIVRVSVKQTKYLKGKCYSYEVTKKACELLADSNRDYWYRTRTDKVLKRKIQKRVSDRGHNKVVYSGSLQFLKVDCRTAGRALAIHTMRLAEA